jgi:peroxiredoxin (alkyl hydroperoxide reductase subunit C)
MLWVATIPFVEVFGVSEETAAPVGRIPLLGEPAPDFEANTTHGIRRLSDYRGKWLMFFSHPGDFTPVCTTELMELARRYGEFQERGVELLGLSVDSVPAHLAWTQDMAAMGQPIPYPIVADVDLKISRLYGMVHPGQSATATVRAVFFIDDRGIVRTLLYYPMSLGRNVDELLRIVDGLKIADRLSCSTPVNWRPGQPVVVPPPASQQAVESPEDARAKGYDYRRWYLRFRQP